MRQSQPNTRREKSLFGKFSEVCHDLGVSAGFYPFEELREGIPNLDPPARLAVIGQPVAHSRSPQMHNPALRAMGLNAQYIRVEVPVGRVAEAFKLFAEQGFWGVNITIPHKVEAMAAVETIDPLARQLGSVNTLVLRDGRSEGFNTDGPGFLNSLMEAFGRSPSQLRPLILGAGGGAGRSVAMQCALAGCKELRLVNRDQSKLMELVRQLRQMAPECLIHPLAHESESLKEAMQHSDLLVNATSLGMRSVDSPVLPIEALRPDHLVYDMVYRTAGATALISAAQRLNCSWADGMSLLLHQGALSLQHWFGKPAPLEAMRQGLNSQPTESAS